MSFQENKIVQYFLTSKAELKKVVWPTKKEVTAYSFLVVGVGLALAVFMGALDYVFNLGIEFLIQ